MRVVRLDPQPSKVSAPVASLTAEPFFSHEFIG